MALFGDLRGWGWLHDHRMLTECCFENGDLSMSLYVTRTDASLHDMISTNEVVTSEQYV